MTYTAAPQETDARIIRILARHHAIGRGEFPEVATRAPEVEDVQSKDPKAPLGTAEMIPVQTMRADGRPGTKSAVSARRAEHRAHAPRFEPAA